MPTQIANLSGKTIAERICDFAKKLPDGEGWSIAETAEKLSVSDSATNVAARKIGIKRGGVWYLVNPKTRAKYAKKN